ncbi:MAG: hypothetical protein H6933_16525 [Burkholderiaceae bacterium]|nr:hypothetical protein [Burkholderiaceae bacterium]
MTAARPLSSVTPFTLGAVLAGALGTIALVWVLVGGVGHHPLALAMTLGIGAVYALGLAELWRFHRDTRALDAAVARLARETALPDWLDSLPAALRQPVRRRIAGAAAPLPGPALTPYLVGLLVLLGMLGTFLGLVVTLDGTVAALERTTDLAAMRAALAAPVKGLGLAFGTSVAGVAASAMLGLMSALLRRVRSSVQQALDRQAAALLQAATPAAQRARHVEDLARQLTDQLATRLEAASQAQAAVFGTHLPGLVDQVQTLLTRLDQQQQARQQQEQAQQAAFQRDLQAQFEALTTRVATTLGTTVAQALRDSLIEGAQAASQALQAAATAAVNGIAREGSAVQARLAESAEAQLQALTHSTQQQLKALTDTTQTQVQALADTTQAQLQALGSSTGAQVQALADSTTAHLAALGESTRAQVQALGEGTQAQLAGLVQRFDTTAEHIGVALQQQAATLADGVAEAHATLQAQADARETQRQAEQAAALQTLAQTFQQQATEAAVASRAQQAAWSDALAQRTEALQQQAATQAREIVAEVARLTATAAEAPRAAAAVIAEMRAQLDTQQTRDAELLDERVRLTEALFALVDHSRQAADAQQAAVQRLVDTSTGLVDAADGLVQRSGEAVAQHWQAALAQQGDAATRIAGGAVEVASLGEAFGSAVAQFADTASTLAAQLQRVESALDQAAVRHDEQLAYYVAQAREVIDLSLGAQQPLLDAMPPLLTALQRIAGPGKADAEVEATPETV